MAIQMICFTLVGIAAIVLLIDIIPILKDWFGRMRIGRYTQQDDWGQAVTNRGIEWLHYTPKIKVTDNTRLVVLDMLRGNYTKGAIQHWQEAALVLGLTEQLKNKNNLRAEAALQSFLKRKFDSNGQWKEKPQHVDGAILAYAVIKLDLLDKDLYKPAFDSIWELIQEHIGSDGTVAYRKFMMNYRYVDTVGFICPFLVAYGLRYNKLECIDLAVKQIQEYEKFGMLSEHHIPCHAYHVEKHTPLGLYGWGRGLGWYAIGLIDTWDELPQDHVYKAILTSSVDAFARGAMRFQQDNGSWNWTVTRPECRSDSSTTATLSWFMLQAAKIESISQDCLESTNKAIGYLMKSTRRNGAVDFSQGDTKDIGVYSMLFNILPFTQGFCMRTVGRCKYKK